MTTQQTVETVDQSAVEAFAGSVLGDLAGLTNGVLASIGDRLGLFRDLATNGPATSVDLAARTGLDERYTREWLGGMACAGYLTYEPAAGRFALPAAHRPVLADEGGPAFFGGVLQELLGTLATVETVIGAFRQGGGVAIEEFDRNTWQGIERFTNGWFNNLLLPHWLPLMPDVRARLERGADVADVGCGHGRALLTLAAAFPAGRYVGYDVSEKAVERARASAAEAGLADRVRFEVRDASRGLPGAYDVVTTFDVVHDAVDPRGMLRAIREALRSDGVYVCLDINCSDRLEENAGPKGALFHGFSILLCMTMSLAAHGEGLGTLGLHPAKLEELCAEAGFGEVRQVPIENPFNNLYEIRP